MTTYIFIKIAFVAFFGLIVWGYFNFIKEAINAIRPTPFGSFGWVFFYNKKTGRFYAYNAVELKLNICQPIENFPNHTFEMQGDKINLNLDLQKYLFDKAKGVNLTFKEISREEFLIAYNTK